MYSAPLRTSSDSYIVLKIDSDRALVHQPKGGTVCWQSDKDSSVAQRLKVAVCTTRDANKNQQSLSLPSCLHLNNFCVPCQCKNEGCFCLTS